MQIYYAENMWLHLHVASLKIQKGGQEKQKNAVA
jgi:hypothetical protein